MHSFTSFHWLFSALAMVWKGMLTCFVQQKHELWMTSKLKSFLEVHTLYIWSRKYIFSKGRNFFGKFWQISPVNYHQFLLKWSSTIRMHKRDWRALCHPNISVILYISESNQVLTTSWWWTISKEIPVIDLRSLGHWMIPGSTNSSEGCSLDK